MSILITGTGSYIPDLVQKNNDFINREFFTIDGDHRYTNRCYCR